MSLPSVTEILKDAGLYGDSERWFRKADRNQPAEYACPTSSGRGTRIDAACNLLLMGKEVDADWLDKHAACCVPFIDGYRSFLQKHRVIKIDCAFEVRHKTERYAGHPDQLVMLDGVRALLDLKTGGMPPICNLQLAGYELAMRDMGMADSRELRVTRFGLQLARGDFRLHPFTDPRDRDEFVILVRAHHIRRKYIAEGP